MNQDKEKIREEDWKDSYKGKLWSTAVQKCFEAPFVEIAIQHLLFKINEKHQEELRATHTDTLKKVQEKISELTPFNIGVPQDPLISKDAVLSAIRNIE